MAKNDHLVEDNEFINMEINSTTTSREFEFQMSFNSQERETTTSPADELFYKGKLLPLQLPPRLQMVQKLLQNSLEEDLAITSSATKLAHSAHFNGEMLQVEATQFNSKRSWSKRLKLSLKLKASKTYLKSLFATKSFILKKSIEREKMFEEECMQSQRKSFSGAINCYLMSKASPAISSCSSSSSSSSFSSVHSNGFYRSSSLNSDMESSIEGAIAYCKKSQVSARKSVSDVEFVSISASAKQERPGLCRG